MKKQTFNSPNYLNSALLYKRKKSETNPLLKIGFAFIIISNVSFIRYYIVFKCSKAALTKSLSGLISLAIVAYLVASALLGVSIDT